VVLAWGWDKPKNGNSLKFLAERGPKEMGEKGNFSFQEDSRYKSFPFLTWNLKKIGRNKSTRETFCKVEFQNQLISSQS